jgi:translation initiation factor IF-1
MTDLDAARDEVSRSSAGGAPFLAVFGATLLACALASLFVTRQQAAMMVMFQGGIALPLAFLLERGMGSGRMADDNPLRPLSIQLAMSQIVAFPVIIAVYSLNPGGVPLAMAAVAGGHRWSTGRPADGPIRSPLAPRFANSLIPQSPDCPFCYAYRVERTADLSKDDLIDVQGTVVAVHSGGLYRVQVDAGHEVLAQLSGRMRRFRIKVVPGDRVTVGVSPYDPVRGIITFRAR